MSSLIDLDRSKVVDVDLGSDEFGRSASASRPNEVGAGGFRLALIGVREAGGGR